MPLSLFAGGAGQLGTAGPSYTFTSLSIGTADASRKVYVCVGTRRAAGGAVSSMTIGGVSASAVVSVSTNSNANSVAIWCAVVPTGTTATVVVTLAGASAAYCSVKCYATTGDHTVEDFQSGSTGPISLSLAVKANGYLIGAGHGANAGPSATWTGITEDTDINTSTQSDTFSTASAAVVADGTASITYDTTGTAAIDGAVVVSLAPTVATNPTQRRRTAQRSIRSTF